MPRYRWGRRRVADSEFAVRRSHLRDGPDDLRARRTNSFDSMPPNTPVPATEQNTLRTCLPRRICARVNLSCRSMKAFECSSDATLSGHEHLHFPF